MEQSLEEIIREKDKDGRICRIDPDATIEEAAKLMKAEHVGALLVMEGDWVVGVLTERDFVYRVIATGLDVASTVVRDVMSKDVVVVKPTLKVQDAMQVISEKRFRHLPVVCDGRLVGVVSSGDLTRRIVADRESMIDTLYDYIQGSYPG